MKKLLITFGMILGFTAAVSAQSVVKEAETASTKPTLLETPKTTAQPVAVVSAEKAVTNTTPVKVINLEKPVTKETPSKAATPVKSGVVNSDLLPKETKTAKQKN